MGLVAFVILAITIGVLAHGAQAHSGGIGSTPLASDAGKAKPGKAKRVKRGAVARRYARMWMKVSPKNKRWARRTAECESGGNPRAIGGGGLYRGAFQFMRSTWRTSPKSPGGDPIRHTYKTQAFVAVRLKMRDGAGHWPTCG